MENIAERLAAVPGVVAVTLGGSRAVGAAVEGSDWDFGLYYRGGLDPADQLAQPGPDLGALVSDVRARLGLRDGVWAGGL